MQHRSSTPARAIRSLGGGVLLVVALTSCGASVIDDNPPASATPSAPAPAAATTPTSMAVLAPPAGLQLPGLETPAPITLAAVRADGQLAVPEDVAELGWWVGSAPMGSASGTTLVAGHVDSATQGLGVFARLRDLTPGAVVTVVDGLGGTGQFRVIHAQQVGKGDLPAELFDTTGPRRLALVTCAGDFDTAARRYADNLIVWADPL